MCRYQGRQQKSAIQPRMTLHSQKALNKRQGIEVFAILPFEIWVVDGSGESAIRRPNRQCNLVSVHFVIVAEACLRCRGLAILFSKLGRGCGGLFVLDFEHV
jgi:hypothetical protein